MQKAAHTMPHSKHGISDIQGLKQKPQKSECTFSLMAATMHSSTIRTSPLNKKISVCFSLLTNFNYFLLPVLIGLLATRCRPSSLLYAMETALEKLRTSALGP